MGTPIWIAVGVTSMRKGINGLAALVQRALAEDLFSGQEFIFRSCCGDMVKMLWLDGDGMCLFNKLLKREHFGHHPENRRAKEDKPLLAPIKQSWFESGAAYGYRKVSYDVYTVYRK